MALVKADNVAAQFAGFSGLPMLRQLGLMIGLAASVALGVAVVQWSQSPTYRLLYSNLSDRDVGQVLAELQAAGIQHKVDEATGAVWVDGDMLHDARMQLAAKSLPRGSGVGFEMMEEKNGFGGSQFLETVRYQRALEGELARTISTLETVRSARVHLAMPKQSVFVRNRKKPSASVVVNLYSGRSLGEEKAQAIVNLVAASVPNLDPSDVTVVDQRGHMLSATHPNDVVAFTATQLDYKRKLEEAYIRRIESILEPVIGVGGVRAQVNAELDFTAVEQTREMFEPDPAAIRSEQTIEESSTGELGVGGIPGSLSNEPPAAASIANQAQSENQTQTGETAASKNDKPQSMRRRSLRNYEVDKTISHTRMAPGAVRRLSVAVIIDDRVAPNEDGVPERRALTEQELTRFTTLVQDAVGFSSERGDRVNVINAAFSVPAEPEALPEESLLEQAWVWDLGKQLLAGLLVLLLVFGVLRPVMRDLAVKERAVPATAGGAPALPPGADSGMAEDQVSLSGGGVAGQIAPPVGGTSGYETNIDMAKKLAAQDPRRVAQVVKNWLAEES